MPIRIHIRKTVVPIRGVIGTSRADKNPYRHDCRADSLSLFSLGLAYVNIVMLVSIFLAMSLDFATLSSVKKSEICNTKTSRYKT